MHASLKVEINASTKLSQAGPQFFVKGVDMFYCTLYLHFSKGCGGLLC